jgi:5-methyltetrahydrofolate--homocysteine methyltransferase
MRSFQEMLREKILVFDGATGTHLQGQNLTADDFGGEHLNGCNEVLVVAKPSAVQNVHRDYLEAGCDIIETNSFGSTTIVLAEYGIADRAHELSFASARIAKELASAIRPMPIRDSWRIDNPTTKLHLWDTLPSAPWRMRMPKHRTGRGGADLL